MEATLNHPFPAQVADDVAPGEELLVEYPAPPMCPRRARIAGPKPRLPTSPSKPPATVEDQSVEGGTYSSPSKPPAVEPLPPAGAPPPAVAPPPPDSAGPYAATATLFPTWSPGPPA